MKCSKTYINCSETHTQRSNMASFEAWRQVMGSNTASFEARGAVMGSNMASFEVRGR